MLIAPLLTLNLRSLSRVVCALLLAQAGLGHAEVRAVLHCTSNDPRAEAAAMDLFPDDGNAFVTSLSHVRVSRVATRATDVNLVSTYLAPNGQVVAQLVMSRRLPEARLVTNTSASGVFWHCKIKQP
jgi:hypothetical protein